MRRLGVNEFWTKVDNPALAALQLFPPLVLFITPSPTAPTYTVRGFCRSLSLKM
jgi:hypothetical protein